MKGRVYERIIYFYELVLTTSIKSTLVMQRHKKQTQDPLKMLQCNVSVTNLLKLLEVVCLFRNGFLNIRLRFVISQLDMEEFASDARLRIIYNVCILQGVWSFISLIYEHYILDDENINYYSRCY